MPLKLRIALMFAVTTGFVITAVGVAFVSQLRDNLQDTLDSGLRDRFAAAAEELATDTSLPTFGPGDGDDPTLVQRADGAVLAASPDATGLVLTPEQHAQAMTGAVYFDADVAGQPRRLLAASTPLGADRVLVVVGTSTEIEVEAVERVRTGLLIGGPAAVLLTGVAAWFLAAAVLRPVERMRLEAAAISDHDSERRLAVPGTRDEVAALATTMNGLLDRLNAALSRERRFVADASHELRTPLAILRAELDLAGRPGRSPEALREAILSAGLETDRLIRLARDLLLLAYADSNRSILRLTRIRLADLLEQAGRRGRSRGHTPAVEIDCPRDLVITADSDRLLQAIDNLLENAILHGCPGTRVRVTAHRADHGVAIEVLDRGPGLPEEFLSRAFERFERAEPARSRDKGGTGLGLSIVRAIAEAHGGAARLANEPEGGARATLWLPLPGEDRTRRPESAVEPVADEAPR